MGTDGSKDQESPRTCDDDALRQGTSFDPKDVASWIFSSDACRSSRLEGGLSLPGKRTEQAGKEKQAVADTGSLPSLKHLSTIDARGTEHSVRYRGRIVEKHQRSNGWVPVAVSGKIEIAHALPSEYLRRLELQNGLFGDEIKIVGLTPSQRFVITQPALRGGEPSELEIRDVLEGAGWRRIPTELQNLPSILMGSVWWHAEEEVILLDARKPNFKKTDFGAILPIDLVLIDLTEEMREILRKGRKSGSRPPS